MAEKKEKHTTFEIGPISEPRMRALLAEVAGFRDGEPGKEALLEALSLNVPRGRTSGVIWQYGGGVVKGAMERLIVPRYAEETPNGTVLITDLEGDRVFEVEKDSLETIWEYSIVRPNVAHRLADGTTIITNAANNLIVQVNKAREVVWSYVVTGATSTYDALKIDGEMVITYFTGVFATAEGHVRKINFVTQATVWDVNVGTPSGPRTIFHIVDQHGGRPSFAPGRDGDYLIGDAFYRVFELRDSDQAIVWQYGTNVERRHAYNRLLWANAAVIGWADINYPLMFITDTDQGSIIAINRLGHKQWQYGWSHPGAELWASGRSPLLNTPDNINFTRHGAMLIADSGGSKVVEVLLTKADVPREWAHLFWAEAIRDVLAHNSLIAETGWYPWKNKLITVENGLNQNVSVQVQGSRIAAFTNPYNIGAAVTVTTATTQAIVVSDPVQFLRIVVTAAVIPTSGSLTAIAEMFDDG